jgi:hypothetical protein
MNPDIAGVGRRLFMKRVMATSGATAFATMGATVLPEGSPMGATPAAADTVAPTQTFNVTDEFFGLTEHGYRITNLFPVHSTGINTGPVASAARAYLNSLTDTQMLNSQVPLTYLDWRRWSMEADQRGGLPLSTLTADQKAAALAILTTGLSAKGLALTETIRRINGLAGIAVGKPEQFNEDAYHITIMGIPSTKTPWGWQLEGHHLVINYFMLGSQVVMSPCFYGSEPTSIDDNGTEIRVFDEHIAAALAMVKSLSTKQRATAILSVTKPGDNNLAEAFKDNLVQAYQGISGAKLTTAQRKLLLKLINIFIAVEAPKQAAITLKQINSWITDTHFAWIGGTTSKAAFYFRIQSPVIWIEFDCALPGPVGSIYGGSSIPTRHHIHSVVRTPNGNDYGKEILRQHYLTSAHHTK